MTDEELDKLVQEDIALGQRILPLDRVRHGKVRLLQEQMRQAEADYARETEAWRTRRQEIRDAILAAWKVRHPGKVTLDLPAARVSLRNYAELKVLDREGLVDALDKAGRLDLVGPAFDEKAVLELLREGKLGGLREGVLEVVDRFNLQVTPKGRTRPEEGNDA